MSKTKKPSEPEVKRALQAAVYRFGDRANVTGIDYGYRWTEGGPTEELCVRIHVEEKIPLSVLESAEVFPETIEGIPVDVYEGRYEANRSTSPHEHAARAPTLMGGISVGHKAISAGTLGAIVIDKLNEQPAILSNWHVLVGATGQVGDEIVQPGRVDGGIVGRDTVATLGRSILDRDGDAAIAHLNGTRPWSPLQFGSFTQATHIRDPQIGEVLSKSGRTTAQTSARVDGSGTYYIRYEVRRGVRERVAVDGFKLVPVIQGNPTDEEVSSGGDSGSLWVDPEGGGVGLHFAGETSSEAHLEHAVACKLTNVARRLNFRFATHEDAETLGRKFADVGPELSIPWPGDPLPWPIGGPWPWPPRPWPPIPPMPWCPACNNMGFDDTLTKPMTFDDIAIRSGLQDFDEWGDEAADDFEEDVEARKVSVLRDIWPELKRGLVSESAHFESATAFAALETFFGKENVRRNRHGAIFRKVIVRSARFQSDGLGNPRRIAFISHRSFYDTLGLLARRYDSLGFTVTR